VVREVLNSGDQEPKPEAVAFNARTQYTMASRLPPDLSNNANGTEWHGRSMLRTISAAFSKARREALARSMMSKEHINTKKATPRDCPNGIGRTHLNRRRY
jgi:hypothetical protein